MAEEPKPTFMLDLAATEEQKKNLQPLLDICPNCHTPTQFGYGLAGGGMGTYVFCETCEYFAKHIEPDEG